MGHEAGLGSVIDLGGVDEERMAKIDCSGGAGCEDFLAMIGFVVIDISGAEAGLACGGKNSGDF